MNPSLPFRNPLVVALDVDTGVQALKLAEAMKDKVGGLKIGPRLALKEGGDFLKRLAECAPVFLDCKFFDIPSVMEHSVRTAFAQNVSVVTVHGLSGTEALKRMHDLQEELCQKRPFRILAVTYLTSFNEQTLPQVLQGTSVAEGVQLLVQDVMNSGLKSIVCSPLELEALKSQHSDLYCLTPGIRFESVENDDQKRVMNPEQALQAGSNAIVVGRPIVAASEPISAFEKFVESVGV